MFLIENGILKGYEKDDSRADVIIPEGVTAIDMEAFKKAPEIKSVTIPEGVTSIGDKAFSGCILLTEATLPETITYIGEDAFNRCSSLTSINTLGQITQISKRAFAGCFSLKSITIPQSVMRIDSGAFFGCSGFTEITLPDNITFIGEKAFCGCRDLIKIDTLGQTDSTGAASDTIPQTERGIIGYRAFFGCTNLTFVTFPKGIMKIGEGAFYNCKKLVSVTLPRGITHIGKDAFYGCSQIFSLKLPDSLEVIGEDAFENCENLKEINIPPSVKKIGMSAFAQCIRMTSVTLPESIDSIPIGMFFNCNSLEEIKLPDNITSIGNSAFGFSNLREVTIPKGVKTIGKSAFSWCPNLRRVTFLGADIEIMLNVFIGCTDLVTNLSIKQWKTEYGFFKLTYAMYYMRQYTPGDPFFENVKEENKTYIKGQLKKLLKNIGYYRRSDGHGIDAHDTNMVIFLTQEKLLRINEVDFLLDEMAGDPEASALLLDYKAQNFSEKFLEKYETDKLNKELGLKERTVAEWKKIYRLADDGNGGYKILGYKGDEVNVEIPAKIGKKPVTAIDDYAFSAEAPHITHAIRDIRRSLETVIIPDSVTSIGVKVFSFCNKLNCIVYRGKEFTPEEFEDYLHPQDPDKK